MKARLDRVTLPKPHDYNPTAYTADAGNPKEGAFALRRPEAFPTEGKGILLLFHSHHSGGREISPSRLSESASVNKNTLGTQTQLGAKADRRHSSPLSATPAPASPPSSYDASSISSDELDTRHHDEDNKLTSQSVVQGRTASIYTGEVLFEQESTIEMSHTCSDCDKVFVWQADLRVHIREQHTGEKPFVCRLKGCERAFRLPTYRQRHEKRKGMHIDPTILRQLEHKNAIGKPLKCKDCGKGFMLPIELNGHIRQRHTGERPFQCRSKDCDKRFSSTINRYSHERNVHALKQSNVRVTRSK
jgi:RNase P subunit RPR2